MTKSQINKLGDSLRAAGPPSEEDLARLQEFRATYDDPMATAQRLIQEALGIETTARLKTTNTIIEKLRRERTRLSEMQDIAGLRIVRDISLAEQDELVIGIEGLIPEAKTVDRRKRPSHGYRAVHVIAKIADRPVEIQIRTDMQDLWAQALERLADRAGREIRYGGIPEGCEALIETLLAAAREVALIEQQQAELRELTARLAAPAISAVGPLQLNRLRVRVGALRANLGERPVAVRRLLTELLGR